MTCQTIPRHGLDKDAHPCLHCVSCGLLQCHSSWITKPARSSDWQATTSDERCSTSRHWYTCDHGLSRLFRDDLHWLDVPERIQYKIGVTVHRCLQSMRPSTWPTVELQSQTLLADATYGQPVDIISLYTSHQFSTFGRRTFSVAGPTVWTPYRTVSETRLSAAAASGNYLIRTYSTVTHQTQRSRDAVITVHYINIRRTLTLTLTHRPVDWMSKRFPDCRWKLKNFHSSWHWGSFSALLSFNWLQ